MAFTITSYTPTTGPQTGGTTSTVTGTGLDTVDVVLVGNQEATIVSQDATSLVFTTPPGVVGAQNVTLIDTVSDVEHQAGTDFTYTSVAGDPAFNTLAGKFALDVRNVGDTDWTRVRGMTSVKVERTYNTEDDSDTDSGIDGSDFVTSRRSNVTGTVKRTKGTVTGDYNAGQELIRLAADAVGTAAGLIEYRVYDRTGGPEAYQGTAIPQWAPQGGNKTADKVDVTLLGQGARETITNPVIADPTLADGYAA